MPLHGIWLINYPIKDGYILRSSKTARHKSNTTIHLILFRKGTVTCILLSSNKSRIHFIYSAQLWKVKFSHSLNKSIIKYYFLPFFLPKSFPHRSRHTDFFNISDIYHYHACSRTCVNSAT